MDIIPFDLMFFSFILFIFIIVVVIIGGISFIIYLKNKMNETAKLGFEEIIRIDDASKDKDKCVCCHEKLTMYIDDTPIDQIKNEFYDENNKDKLVFIYFKYFNEYNLRKNINKRCTDPDCRYYNIRTLTTEDFDKFDKEHPHFLNKD